MTGELKMKEHSELLQQTDKESTLEKLATLEHEQWAHWTRYMLENLTADNIERWKLQIETPYSNLTELEKESDRVWARKTLKICCLEIG